MKAKVEPKCRFFSWLLLQRKILTSDKIIWRGGQADMHNRNWITKTSGGWVRLFTNGHVNASPEVSSSNNHQRHIDHKDQNMVVCHGWIRPKNDSHKPCPRDHLCCLEPMERVWQQNTNTDTGNKSNTTRHYYMPWRILSYSLNRSCLSGPIWPSIGNMRRPR